MEVWKVMLRRNKVQPDESQWLGYTDIFASSLLILILVTVVSAINNANNQKPPLITLTESESYRFTTGSHKLSKKFKAELGKKLNDITRDIQKYNIDTIEVIGHTDGQPSPGMSNLDISLLNFSNAPKDALHTMKAGSNIDLGLLRALSVASFLKEKLTQKNILVPNITPYSAGSLINTNGHFNPANNLPNSQRRRIEIRFTRSEIK